MAVAAAHAGERSPESPSRQFLRILKKPGGPFLIKGSLVFILPRGLDSAFSFSYFLIQIRISPGPRLAQA